MFKLRGLLCNSAVSSARFFASAKTDPTSFCFRSNLIQKSLFARRFTSGLWFGEGHTGTSDSTSASASVSSSSSSNSKNKPVVEGHMHPAQTFSPDVTPEVTSPPEPVLTSVVHESSDYKPHHSGTNVKEARMGAMFSGSPPNPEHEALAKSALADLRSLIQSGKLAEASELYEHQSATLGSDFYSPVFAPWALELCKAHLAQGQASRVMNAQNGGTKDLMQFWKESFDFACDAILMQLGHDSAQYKKLEETEWFSASEHPFRDLCVLCARPVSQRVDTVSLAQTRIYAARSLFGMAHYGGQWKSAESLYDLSAMLYNAALSSLLKSDTAEYSDVLECRRMLALCYRRRKMYEWAWLVLEDGLRECKHGDTAIQTLYWADIGALCLNAGRFNAGGEAFDRALKTRSRCPPELQTQITIGMAQCLGGMSNARGAIVAFQEAIEAATEAYDAGKLSLTESAEIHATAFDYVSHFDKGFFKPSEFPEFERIRDSIVQATARVLDQWEQANDIRRAKKQFDGEDDSILTVGDVDVHRLRIGGRKTAWTQGDYLKDVREVKKPVGDEIAQAELATGKIQGIDTLM
eukprot:ANDGO_03482.mRNA.1 hypothetical protein